MENLLNISYWIFASSILLLALVACTKSDATLFAGISCLVVSFIFQTCYFIYRSKEPMDRGVIRYQIEIVPTNQRNSGSVDGNNNRDHLNNRDQRSDGTEDRSPPPQRSTAPSLPPFILPSGTMIAINELT